MKKQNENKLSPMMQQYRLTKQQYEDCILFYRLGDFYEMFDQDAIVASKELDLTLTGKDCGEEQRAPMCGVPYHAYESYAQKLIEKGYKVAICEQTDKMVDKVMQREVVRIITPGTVVESSMLNDKANSYMMSIVKIQDKIAYAYADISTGEVYVGEYSGKNLENYINDQIVRIMPAEIICNSEVKDLEKNIQIFQTNNKLKLNLYYDWAFNYSDAERQVLKQYGLSSLKGFDFNSKLCIVAVGSLLQYFLETQKRELKHLKLPKVLRDDQFMYVDTNTRRNLEIEASMHENTKYGSLLWVLDKTNTSGGSRMLRSWVRQPLQDKNQINLRLDMIECLVKNEFMRLGLVSSLSPIQDIERLIGKLSYGNINPKECYALAVSLDKVAEIREILESSNDKNYIEHAKNLHDVSGIVNLIFSTISENAPVIMKEGGYIKSGFNPSLDELRNMKQNAEDIILGIQAKEREETGIKNLKIGYNRVFGYYIEVNKQFSEQVPFTYIRKQTISNNERYITEELKKFEEDVLTSQEKAIALEEKIFIELKNQLLQNTAIMQDIATELSTIDCLVSLATVAIENDYVRPTITNTKEIEIVAGRHPVIEKINKSDFIPNDCTLNDSDQRTMILTGPNMAGKSTFMRQVALITYMAHVGSFVPAESAKIGIVDRIFTRIGASDDLAVGQSTFMVEMIEVANILSFATNNSLIILDEVGRGTSTFDGLSIAWSVVEYLSKHLKAKTLFATHYHELMQLEGKYEGVKNFCISIKEIGGKLVFLRKIMRGSATKSYGIEVASLAGLPQSVVDRAKELILELENEKMGSSSEKESEITNILKEIDMNKISPLVAFDTLSHLVNLVK
ncbi:MAG: DNA mismatch repair protein MutS [Candidatus Onthoplasma sp.]